VAPWNQKKKTTTTTTKRSRNIQERFRRFHLGLPHPSLESEKETIIADSGISIRQTDRFKRSSIKDLSPHGIKEKQECRRFRMKIQERDSRDRSRLEIFLPAVLCTSSLCGESMRRRAS
jgi:hypothetical protein